MESPRCPFCNIAATNAPIPLDQPDSNPPESDTAPTAHLILSTEHVLAFLDIMPLSRGHVLVTPRQHYETLGDMGVEAGQELGKWLPIISRVVTRVVYGDAPDKHWNVVQNNGARAAQVVPHVHFHIVPRPATNSTAKPSFAMFGRGQREELDDEEGEVLAREMRAELAREVSRIWKEEGIDLTKDLKPHGKL